MQRCVCVVSPTLGGSTVSSLLPLDVASLGTAFLLAPPGQSSERGAEECPLVAESEALPCLLLVVLLKGLVLGLPQSWLEF